MAQGGARWRWLRPLAVAACLAGCWRSPRAIQRDYAETLKPAAVAQSARAPGPVRAMRVRIHVDPEYQAQTPRWSDRIRAQIERADQVLEAQFAVRLEVESIRRWEGTHRFENLEKSLGRLMELDPGGDVEWVIGFLPSLQVASATQDQLGVAALFGRHFVLRGSFSLEEAQALERVLDRLPAEEREALFRERRLHKETAVLLHEWAHTLGAFHEHAPGSFLSPTYEPSLTGFSPEAVHLLQVGLAHRNRRDAAGRQEWSNAYRDAVRSATTLWGETERDAALAAADAFFGGMTAERAEAPPPRAPDPAERQPSGALSPADAQQLDAAIRKARAGDFARAAQILAPLARQNPRDPQVQGFFCSLAEAQTPRAPQTLATCRAASRLPGAPAEISLIVARLLLGRDQRSAAVIELANAEGALGKSPSERTAWLMLAQLYARAQTCSGAERAAIRAKGLVGAEQIALECVRLRHRVGLPREGSPVPPDREHEYVEAILQAEQDVHSSDLDRAMTRAKELRKSFPAAPGAALVECLVRGRNKALALTKTACEAAARAAPEAFFPRYLIGLVASAEGRWRDAQSDLRRALALDDSTYQPWVSLAAVYQRLGEAGELEELKRLYRARFGSELRPALWPDAWGAETGR